MNHESKIWVHWLLDGCKSWLDYYEWKQKENEMKPKESKWIRCDRNILRIEGEGDLADNPEPQGSVLRAGKRILGFLVTQSFWKSANGISYILYTFRILKNLTCTISVHESLFLFFFVIETSIIYYISKRVKLKNCYYWYNLCGIVNILFKFWLIMIICRW